MKLSKNQTKIVEISNDFAMQCKVSINSVNHISIEVLGDVASKMHQVQRLLDLETWVMDFVRETEIKLEKQFRSQLGATEDMVSHRFMSFNRENLEEWYYIYKLTQFA